MPPKTQFTVENVVMAALELVREKSLAGLSAPAVAAKMGCSTMPIYSHFKNMQALEDEVVTKAWEMIMKYEGKRYTGDAWIDQTIGYVRFARDEHNLFRCLLEGRNPELRKKMLTRHWQYLTDLLEGYDSFKNLNEELTGKIRYARAMLSHGVAMFPRTGLNKIILENDEILSTFLTLVSHVLLTGYKETPPLEGDLKRAWEEMKMKYIEISS